MYIYIYILYMKTRRSSRKQSRRKSRRKSRKQSRRKNRKQSRRKQSRRKSRRKNRKQSRRKPRKFKKYNSIGGDNTGLSPLAKHLLLKKSDEFGWKLVDDSKNLIDVEYNQNDGIRLENDVDKEIERISNLLGGTDNNDGLLEQNEKDSLIQYTGNAFQSINENLRSDSSEVNDYIHDINNAFLKTPKTEKEIVVVRGLEYDINHYIQRNSTSNHEIYDKAYMSTTTNITTAGNFFNQRNFNNIEPDDYMCCFMIITIPIGSKVIPLEFLTIVRGEKEILLPSHSLLRFVKQHNLWNENRQVSAKLYEYKYIEPENVNAAIDGIDNAIEVEIQPTINLEPSAPSPEDLESPEVIKRPVKKNTLSTRVGWDSIKMISRAVDQITNNPDFEPLRDMKKTGQEPFMPPLPKRATDESTYSKSRLHKWMKKGTDKGNTPRKQSKTKKK